VVIRELEGDITGVFVLFGGKVEVSVAVDVVVVVITVLLPPPVSVTAPGMDGPGNILL
jgi:hypothetical protein